MFIAPALPPEQPRVEAYVDNVTVVLNFTFGPSNGCEFAELEVANLHHICIPILEWIPRIS